ncbi:MAG: DUF5131 family protein [Gimesia sp.]|nr:DUF5131 family protein [Gimesia sp.]
MEKTLIAWTDATFNPWMGCTKVSEGCRNCYALTLTKNRMGLDLWGNAPRQVTKAPWENVRKWNTKAASEGNLWRVFCASLCDIFEDHPVANETRPKVFELMKKNSWLHFQVLTKRPERIADNLPDNWGDSGYPNVWLGTSIEDMQVAERADLLRKIPAVLRFISYEPALGSLTDLDLSGIDWVIYGGESGPGHRPEDKQWARDMWKKCTDSGAAFFHKQSAGHRTEMGIELDGDLIRQFPTPREYDFSIPFRSLGSGMIVSSRV